MKYNFTESGVPMPIEGDSQQRQSDKDTKVLEFVQKIVSVISLFFKPKSSHKAVDVPQVQKSGNTKPHGKLFAENSLQEYFADKFPPQLSPNNVKSVPDLITNQDLTMNKLSLNSSSTVKEYHLGSQFDEKLKRWIPSFSSPTKTYDGDDYPKNSFFKGFATTILLVLISVLGVAAQSFIDLSLRKTIDKSLPALNDNVKYTLWLKNSGPSTASTIVVQDNFPIAGAVLNTHTGGANFTYSPLTGIGKWNVATLAAGDSVKLEITATVTQQGVFFNTAEVFSVGAGQEDSDSTPNNSKLYEDDIASACFSVPLYWYPGEEYTVSVPAPYKYGSTIKWFNGTTEITPSSTIAVINADSSLTIKAPGTFTFTTNVTNCPAQGCCAVQVVEGPYGSIGDYVWQDTNNDGKQGSTTTEPPIAGVKVYLLSASGTKLDSTITNAQGKYLFDSLTTDSYRVQFVKPVGYDSFTAQNLGTDDTKDSDVGLTGLSQLINIDTSKLPSDTLRNNLNIDAGLKPNYGSIGDYVWSDVNNNGQQNSGEAPIAGVKIYLLSASGTKLDSTVTDAAGKYLFDSLASGTYKVQFIAPTGTIAAKQNTGADVTDSDANKNGITQLITIDTTKPTTDTLRNNLNIDAGFVPVGSIGDYVFADNNGDGIQNTGDTPVAGVKVYLLDATTGAKLDSTITNGAGKYLFDSLLAGSYKVKFVLPTGSEATGKLLGGNTATDSNINPDGTTDTIVIDTTQPINSTARNNTTIDAGLKTAFGSIGDYVWSDVNNNGQQDSGEAPIAGVKVYLLSATGTKLDSTLTDAAGKYLFSNLISGTYKVQFTAPTGTIAAKQNTGADVTDSDANKNGISQLITIDTTKPTTDTLRNNLNIDAGFVPVGSIGDYVFADNNGDGIQNTGDSPVAGVKVYLLDANTGAKLDSAITDINGKYLFDSLLNGTYKVKFVIPVGSTITGKALGGNPSLDSDPNPDGTTDVITINTSLPIGNVGRNNTTVDAGLKTAFGSIGDFVWNDSNNNGLQDSGETGVSGIIIELYASDAIGMPIGSPLKKDTTDASGKYLFSGLSAGNYVVKVVTSSIPSGSQLTTKQNVGTNKAIDSDFNPSTGLSDKIVIDPYDATKKDILTVDGGIYSPLGSIGDFVWNDTNNNGLQDTGEPGVSGVKVELYASDASGNPVGAAINTVTTNASGFYTFNNLPKGDYVVRIVTSTLPASYVLSTKANAGDDTKDSDFNPTTGYSPKISIDPLVPALKDNPTIDGAIYLPVVCSELVAIATDADICSGDTTYIKATITGGGNVRWYLTPIGGTPIATVASGASYAIFPTTTTVYYAEIANAPEGCPNTRQPVAIVVNVRPANPSCVGAVEECIGKTINLNNFVINGVTTPGGTFEWHTTANPSSPLVSNPAAVGAGTYYLFEKSGAGCYSNPTLLKVTLKNCDKSIDLSLTKVADNITPNVGDNITFTIKVTNAGPDAATAVEVTDELPAGLQFVSSAFFTNNSGVLTSTISNVAANQTITLTYIAKVTGSAAMTNFAQITKATEKDKDSTPGNGKTTKEDDDDKVTITPKVVELLADLSLNKTVSNATPFSGDQITYYVEVKNNGTSNATNIEATDVVPAGLQIISATGGDAITTTGNTVVAKFNQINVGQTATFQIVAKVTATTGTIKNWAEVTKSDQKDPNSTPNNGVAKNEDDDDDADITIRQQVCNPTTPLIACANPYICLGESVSIEAIGCNGTVVWSDGQTGNMITVTPGATTTYTAQCKINDNCISPKSNPVQVVVNVIAPPTITSNSTSNVICNGGSVTLTANNCTGRILWSTGATTPSITVSPTTTTSYTATCTKLNCVSSKSNVITVTVGTPTTPPTITADNNTVCAGQSVKLTANGCTGTVVWSNGSTGSSITFAPTSTGTYSAVCKVGECSSNASTPITITVGAGSTPTITATKDGICAGESVTLTASNCTGTLTWSTGATTSSITVSPTANTTYDVTCSVNGCSGKVSKEITVTPKPATPIVTCGKERICAGESLTFNAAGCAGTVTWSNGATGATMVVNPTVTTTYTAICTVNGCSSSPSKDAVITVLNQNPPTITASAETVCSGGAVILTVSNCDGTVLWSTGSTAGTISVTPAVATTYTVKCIVGECESSASKTINIGGGQTPNAPTISANKTAVCGNETATLTATGCTGGTVTWSNGATGSSIIVGAGTYTAICKTDCGTSGNSNAVFITSGGAGSTPTITAAKDGICVGESVTLTASNCTGTLTWSTGATTSSITVSPTANTTYDVTCSVNGCSGKVSKAITVTPKPATPIVTCGKERICLGESLTFTAHGCEGTVTWSTGATGATMVVTPTNPTNIYTAVCTVNGCASSPSKDAVITVINLTPPTITASTETVCSGGSATLNVSNCDGTVLWSTGATTASITVTPTATTTYTVKCIVDECESSASKTINIGTGQTPNAPIISANKTAVCGNETATLTATGCTGGTITWSNGATGSSINVAAGTYTAICKTDCGTSGNSNAIVIQTGNVTPPIISASTTALCETGQVTLTAAGCTGTVIWSNTSTGSSITVSVATTTTFSAACKTAACESGKSNDITVTVGKPNKPTITSDKQTICEGDAVVLTATGCEGTTVWSNGLTGSTINVSPSTTTDYTAVCKLPQGGCTSDQSNKVTVNVTTKPESPVISCSASRICKGDTLTLNALGCSGSILWSTGQTSASININPAETTVYTAICKVGSCQSAPSAAATITVGNPIPPVVTCKNTQICGGSSTQIEAAGCTGTVKWSDGQIGAVITVSPTSITSYYAICDGGRCQSEKSNVITVQVTGSGLKKPTTRDLVNTCPYITVDLTTGVTSTASSQGGVFVFRTGTTPGSPAVANPSTASTGTYYVFEKAGNGCYSEGAKINVNITSCEPPINCSTNPATALAGKDTTVCLSADFFTLQGKIGGSATSAKWTTDGKGTFDNALSLNTKYNYSNDDVVKGSVKFTLTTNDPDDNGSCVAATSSFTVTLNGVKTVPTIESSKSPNICFGDSVVLTATNAGSYKWSTGATTKSITVKTPGRYTVKLINDSGCASLSSNEIVVKLGDAITAPTVTALTKNNCPATTVNLASSVTSQIQSAGGVFEFHTGSLPSSPMLANASAVGSGTYYVIEKSGIGCYSQASPIIVTIDQCNVVTDTSKVDVSVLIVGSRVELKIGDPVTYTITVKNNSTVKAATNVNVVNVLPKGLTVTSTTPGFTAFGTDSLVSVIGNLPAGATKTYTYDAKTTKAGQIINTAKITKLDQVDPILSNNISQWTVECKTCQETCVGLALAADTTRQANGSYNITFRALIEACGNVKLEGVKITENLSTMFPLPTTYTIVQKPTAGVGSLLKTNDSFNGTTDLNLTIPEGSIVEAGKVDTVKFVVNIVPNGKEGPFSTNSFVEAIGNTAFGIPQDVSDVSNNGKTVVKESAEPTVVRLYKSPSVGLAKIVLDTTKKANGSYDVTYQLLVKNNGSLTLNDVIVRDTLTKVFKAPATFTVVAAPSKNTSSQLTINSAFNGTTDTRLTLTGSTIAIGKTDTLKFTVNVNPDTLKTFANTAVVSGSGTLTSGTTENVTDLSNAGLNPDAPGSNPTNLNLNADGSSSIEVPCIGIALYVKDTVRQADSSYNITYKAIIKNCGNLNLTNVQVCDTLSRTFTSPAVAKLAVKPTVSAGSLLKVDTSYNGTTKTCMLLDASQLAPNKVDTLTWVVNVKLNGNKGPFRNTVIVTAKTPSGQVITDASNAGIDPNPAGSTPTVINFNSLPDALIGISKSASEPKLVTGTTNTYDVTFTFKVKNYGKVAFTGVQIQDNLSVAFGDSVKIDSVKVTADAGLTANSSYTGRGSLINLLVDSLSTLPVNTERNVTLFARMTTTSSKANFENQALVVGKYPSNKSTDDLSTNGNDPDPDANGTPKDNSIATPVKLGDGGPIIPSFSTTLGIAKSAILDTVKNADGSYNLTYKVIVKNYSTSKLTNIQLSDSLSKVFADSAEFVVVGKPVVAKNSKLKIDSTFNGRTVTTMLIADSSSLAVGASDTLTFKLRLLSAKKGDATYSNSITGTAKDGINTVRDISQSGLNPDPDADNNPGNNNQPTVITIKGQTAITDTTNRGKIPQAFSPNGDGTNDLFIIQGINGRDDVKAEIYIYNRWGQLVYQNTDFGKVDGWDGTANNGIVIGNKGAGVPDGTYFICVKAAGFWENKPQVNFITIAR